MKPSTRTALDTAWYLLVFLALQFIATYLAAGVYAFRAGVSLQDVLASFATGGDGSTTSALLAGTLLSNLATIALFLKMKWTPASLHYLRARPCRTLGWTTVLALSLLLPLSWIYERLGITLDDNLQALFGRLMQTPWGYVAIALLAPMAEEMVFRGAVLRVLLSRLQGQKAWLAVVISAVLFGAVHGNAAQFVNAFAVGILLGWLYLRTGSIVAGTLFHWVNNTAAFLMAQIEPQKADASLADLFGGHTGLIVPCVSVSFALACLSFYAIRRALRTEAANSPQ